MIAVTSALVVPSISSVSSGSVEDETSRLRLVMRFAMEESQLSGLPIRWLATKESWSFEALEQGEIASKWTAYETDPLVTYALPQGVTIESVEQAGEFAMDMESFDRKKNPDKNQKEVARVIGMVLLLPDGTTSQSNIQLSSEDGSKILEVRPGPAGIKVKKEEE